MAWSEKAIEAAYLKLVGALDENMMEHHLQDVCQLIIAALDAAAAVDGDAGWNEAIEAAAKKAEKSFHMEEFSPGCDVIISDDRDDIASAIRSLKRLK